MNIDKSYLTAIARKSLPVPTRWLLKHKSIVGRTLDYGCGKCHDLNNRFFRVDGYDPHFNPWGNTPGAMLPNHYNTVVCNYVLCVVPAPQDRLYILRDIQDSLTNDGVAFISVRNDTPQQGHGKSSRGTFQVKIDKLFGLRTIHICSQFRMFLLTKNSISI